MDVVGPPEADLEQTVVNILGESTLDAEVDPPQLSHLLYCRFFGHLILIRYHKDKIYVVQLLENLGDGFLYILLGCSSHVRFDIDNINTFRRLLALA